MKKRLPFLLFLSALLAAALYACKKDAPVTVDFKYDYFPVDSGRWAIYEVDSVTYDNFTGIVDTAHYELKEIIESTFKDNTGRTVYRLERWRRDADTLPWRLTDVWEEQRLVQTAERVEENLRFIKLIFPPANGDHWNGNSYIDASATGEEWLSGWRYEYLAVDEPASHSWVTIDSVPYTLNFDSVLVALGQDEDILIERTYAEERYAKGVGLYFKKYIHLESQNLSDTLTIPWTQKADKGFILNMRLRSFGI